MQLFFFFFFFFQIFRNLYTTISLDISQDCNILEIKDFLSDFQPDRLCFILTQDNPIGASSAQTLLLVKKKKKCY